MTWIKLVLLKLVLLTLLAHARADWRQLHVLGEVRRITASPQQAKPLSGSCSEQRFRSDMHHTRGGPRFSCESD